MKEKIVSLVVLASCGVFAAGEKAFQDYSGSTIVRRIPVDEKVEGENFHCPPPSLHSTSKVKGCEPFTVEAPRPVGGSSIRAVDFGFSVTNDDNAAAINAAIAEARRVGARHVTLAPGVYRCFGAKGIFMEGFDDFTFDGAGAELVFRRKPAYPIRPSWDHDSNLANFVVRNCHRVSIGGFDMDWDWRTMPLATCAKCVGTFVDPKKDNASYIDFELIGFERHPLYGRPMPVQKIQCMTDDFRHFAFGPMLWDGVYEGDYGSRSEWLSPTRVRVYPGVWDEKLPHWNSVNASRGSAEKNRKVAGEFKTGMSVRIKHCYYGKGAFTLESNEDCDVHDVNVYSCFGWGVYVGGSQHRWSLRNVSFMPRDVRHPVSTSSDTIHLVRSRGLALLENITVGFEDDDAVNLHDRFTVAKRTAPDTLEVILKRGARYFLPGVGNEVELRNPGYGPTGWRGRVKRLEGERIVFDRPLPEKDPVEGWFLVFDRTDSSDGVILRNCRFDDMEMRTLINVSNVTVENCLFRRTNGDALRMLADYTLTYWCEGMGTTNILVRNCTFENNSVRECVNSPWSLGSDIAVCISHPPQVAQERLYRDYISSILVENCTFRNSLGYFADLRFGRNLTFRNNTIIRDGTRAECRPTSGSVRLENVQDVTFEGNTFKVPKDTPTPWFDVGSGVEGAILRNNRIER